VKRPLFRPLRLTVVFFRWSVVQTAVDELRLEPQCSTIASLLLPVANREKRPTGSRKQIEFPRNITFKAVLRPYFTESRRNFREECLLRSSGGLRLCCVCVCASQSLSLILSVSVSVSVCRCRTDNMEITVLGIQDRDATPTLEKRQEKRHGTERNIYLGALLKSNLRLNFVLASSEWQKSMFRIRMWSYEIVSSCHCETRAIW